MSISSIDADCFVGQAFVGFVGAGEFKRVRDRGLSLFHGGDDVGTAQPVSFLVVGFGPLGRVVRVRVVEADDVLPALSPFALDADQLLGVDVVAVVGGIGAGIAAACGRSHDLGSVVFKASEQDAAALMRIGFFAVLAKGFEVGAGEF